MDRNKITFIAWSPDDAGIQVRQPLSPPFEYRLLLTLLYQPKMIYASSKEALKRALNGFAVEMQANDNDEIEWDSLVKTVSKGTAA